MRSKSNLSDECEMFNLIKRLKGFRGSSTLSPNGDSVAFQQGQQDFYDGEHLNRYPAGTQQHRDWEWGHGRAEHFERSAW